MNDLPAYLIAFTIFGLTCLLNTKTLVTESTHQRLLVPPPDGIEHLQIGFKESVADSLWIRWIQDIDTCYVYNRPLETIEVSPAEIQERLKNESLTYNPRHKMCDNSWGFKMLDSVTKLDPKFAMPYQFGAGVLSVMVEDFEGASVIFDRGIKEYPEDWEIAYRAAYHYLFDKQDYVRSAQLLEIAAENGAPIWVRSLAARLYSKSGQIELGISTLQAYRAALGDNPEYTKPIDERIANLKRQLETER